MQSGLSIIITITHTNGLLDFFVAVFKVLGNFPLLSIVIIITVISKTLLLVSVVVKQVIAVLNYGCLQHARRCRAEIHIGKISLYAGFQNNGLAFTDLHMGKSLQAMPAYCNNTQLFFGAPALQVSDSWCRDFEGEIKDTKEQLQWPSPAQTLICPPIDFPQFE